MRASAVRPTIITASASSTPEMNTLRPDRTHSSPSRSATVASRCELDPASGSVMPNAMMADPLARPGSQCCCCTSVPNRAMMVPQMAGDTTIISSPQPAAASSSSTMASSYSPAPPPP